MTEVASVEKLRSSSKWKTCNGRQFCKMFQAGLIWLEENYQHVNSLNVFPVPDGDTGTNMLLTMRAAYKRIENNEDAHVGRVAHAAAQGALMGARGNSGVILSQIWRGLASSLKGVDAFDTEGMARALRQASDTAYKGVMKPVEGTILTVIREAADEAEDAAPKSADLRFLLERVLERCQQALERTPEQLPILKQAGVVDSGGQGLVYILRGMLNFALGQLDLQQPLPTLTIDGQQPAQALARPEDGHLDFPYDVQFILLGENLDVLTVRNTIDAMGDSTVVVGDDSTIKVHIHVKDPGEPLTYGARLGTVTDVVVENMQMQMEEIIERGTVTAPAALAAEAPVLQTGQIGIVAVAPGPGLAEVLRSLGVTVVVDGGQTNNPSTEEIFQAIQDVPSNKVIILPNNKNIILAAEAARDLSSKEVAVVRTRTVPQGICALLGHNPDGDVAATARTMEASAREVVTGEITVATRSVELDGVAVAEGNVIGLIDGQLKAAGTSVDDVLWQMLDQIDLDEHEIVSLYFGADVNATDAAHVAGLIEAQAPDLEVEILPGGQPHYYYIFGIE